ncbi:MAG: hypothetical protein H6669_01455 [Ardenticatenaceae bacterium]|nr:hypothetical protein [Ardenticatenaceae bacterium]
MLTIGNLFIDKAKFCKNSHPVYSEVMSCDPNIFGFRHVQLANDQGKIMPYYGWREVEEFVSLLSNLLKKCQLSQHFQYK